MTAPHSFPPLPPHPNSRLWSSNIRTAYQLISSSYDHGIRIRDLDTSDPLQIEIAMVKLIDMRPMVVGMTYDGAPDGWIRECVRVMMLLGDELQSAYDAAQGE